MAWLEPAKSLSTIGCVTTNLLSRAACAGIALASTRALSASRRHYSEAVKDHFKQPRNVGSLDSTAPDVGTAVVGKASCGDVIKLQIKVEQDVIQDVKFKAFGCGSAIASSSLASELIKGKTTSEALGVRNVDIAETLSLPPVKFHCSLLAEDAVKHAVQDYQRKQANIKAEETVISEDSPT